MPPKKAPAQPRASKAKAQPAKPATPALAPAAPQAAAPALPPAPEGFINVIVDGTLIYAKKGSTVMQVCKIAEKEIPHFCFHERLSVAGNCRMCMVEIEGMPKPVASCHWPAAEGMRVKTSSPIATAARKGTMELLLINHPLDCPICDQGGECTLQDLSVAYGGDRTHYAEEKREVTDKELGSKIKTVMTRCIHCTRCIRFATEMAGVEEMGATFRGENMQVGPYVEQALQSELAGNMVDLCPVGALTNKQFAFKARPWELEGTPALDVVSDALGSHLRVDTRAGQVLRLVPAECDAINEEWLPDRTRFSVDALASNRLTTPMVKKGKAQQGSNWPDVFDALKRALEGVKPARMAGLASPLHSAEDLLSFKLFMQKVLLSDNIDARPSGNLLQASMPHKMATTLKDLENAGAVLLIGTNPRMQAPLLNLRLRRMALKKKTPIFSIGQVTDLTYPHTSLGTTPADVETLANARSGKAHETFKSAANPVVIVGEEALIGAGGLALLSSAQKLAKKLGATLSVLPAYAGSVNVQNLAVYPADAGTHTQTILSSLKKGKLDVLFIYGDGSVRPDDLAGIEATTVYIGTHQTEVAKACTFALPAAAWTEKSGLYTNAEGRTQESPAATKPPLAAKEDWKIFRALSEELGHKLPFDTLAELRHKLAETNPCYAESQRGIPQVAMAGKPLPESDDKLPKAFPASASVTNHYTANEYLTQSPWMHQIQAEQRPTQQKVA